MKKNYMKPAGIVATLGMNENIAASGENFHTVTSTIGLSYKVTIGANGEEIMYINGTDIQACTKYENTLANLLTDMWALLETTGWKDSNCI